MPTCRVSPPRHVAESVVLWDSARIAAVVFSVVGIGVRTAPILEKQNPGSNPVPPRRSGIVESVTRACGVALKSQQHECNETYHHESHLGFPPAGAFLQVLHAIPVHSCHFTDYLLLAGN